jgi:hypothetical protein
MTAGPKENAGAMSVARGGSLHHDDDDRGTVFASRHLSKGELAGIDNVFDGGAHVQTIRR